MENKNELDEMLWLRGIGYELTKMGFPRIENLEKLLNTRGYTIKKK